MNNQPKTLTQDQANQIKAYEVLKEELNRMKKNYQERLSLMRQLVQTNKKDFPKVAENFQDRAEDLQDTIRDIDHSLYLAGSMENFDLKEALAAWTKETSLATITK